MTTAEPTPRRFQFSLRGMLLTVLTVCLLLAVEKWLALGMAYWLVLVLALIACGRQARLFGDVSPAVVYAIFLLLTTFGVLVLRTLLWTI